MHLLNRCWTSSGRNVFEAVEKFKDVLETGGIGYLNVENIQCELRGKASTRIFAIINVSVNNQETPAPQ
jgi:hypothetical protein